MSSKIVGVDEAGRGPLAGPVVAAAVILPAEHTLVGLADSKQLSEKKREALYPAIIEQSLDYGIGQASVEEIDSINILQATFLAMQRAIAQIESPIEICWIDGHQAPPLLQHPVKCIVGGDRLHACISAASILAKVTRDRMLVELAERYPEYGFAKHKGYGTKVHLEALQQWGPTPAHRRSFAPVKNAAQGFQGLGKNRSVNEIVTEIASNSAEVNQEFRNYSRLRRL